ncbi:phosphotransferase [uncultured Ferrimonas sp.]|uniref:phosphotransferase n=1 Tax=uncultured Ferrimonas sp. TaxID=432640 RepID=UPI002635C9A7|nr:phosphotransferase [uncultured Ferrimonas sp.]
MANLPEQLWHQAMPQFPLSALVPLAGASANQLYLVDAGLRQWVLRLHGNDNQFAVNRDHERRCWQACAQANLAPPLHYWSMDNRFCISEFCGIEPPQLQPEPLAQLLQRLHQLDGIGAAIDYQQEILGYLQGVDHTALAPYLAQLPHWLSLLHRSQLALTWCHRDLHRGNIRQCDGRYLVLDFEYAAYAHPLFDLAQAQAQLPAAQQASLVQRYYQLRQQPFDLDEQQALHSASAIWQLTNAAWALRMLQQANHNNSDPLQHTDTALVQNWYRTAVDWLNLN